MFNRRPHKAKTTSGLRLPPVVGLTGLTAAAVAIHGYHYGADDGAVYLPAILKSIHPALYPYGAEFFESHAKFSRFTAVVAASARLTHLSVEWVIFLWHFASIFAFLFATWKLASVCFDSERARWSAVLLLVTLLTLPAAGTALVLMDPYLTARSASTPLTVFAIAAFLAGRRRETVIWLGLTALVHPQMAICGVGCVVILALPDRWTRGFFEPRIRAGGARAAALPAGFSLDPAIPEYRQVLDMRSFLSIADWEWYELCGIVGPLAILIWLSRLQPRGATPAFNRICRALILFGLLATLIAIVFASTPRLETFLRLQPLRAFHVIYVVLFALLGGLLGEYVLQSRRWLWLGVFTVIGGCMFFVQRQAYAHSRHIEWPGVVPTNPWVSAFVWVRNNTPQNAVFALDPSYIEIPGEDQHGFRGIAERSVLSDRFKDSGVVSLFPQLAPEWAQEQQAQQGWSGFSLADFEQLARRYPVSWVVLQGNPIEGLDCVYANRAVNVCRIPGAPGLK